MRISIPAAAVSYELSCLSHVLLAQLLLLLPLLLTAWAFAACADLFQETDQRWL